MPSIEVACWYCGTALWESLSMHDGHPEVVPVCIACLINVLAARDDEPEVGVMPEQREAVKEQLGVTDADIKGMVTQANEILATLAQWAKRARDQ